MLAQVAQSDAGDQMACFVMWWIWVRSRQVRQHSFMDIDHEIFSTVIPFH